MLAAAWLSAKWLTSHLNAEPKQRFSRFRRGQKAHKAQQGFDKLLAGGGEWEIVKGRGRAITPAPAYIWDALANYAPLAAEIAAAASNAASAAKYFEVRVHQCFYLLVPRAKPLLIPVMPALPSQAMASCMGICKPMGFFLASESVSGV